MSDLAALASSIHSGFSVRSAVGIQLDALGNSFAIPRQEGWDDETYRSVLLRKLKRFSWDGTNETLSKVLAQAFPGRGAALIDNQDGTVSFTLSGEAPPFPLEDLIPLPAGVRLR